MAGSKLGLADEVLVSRQSNIKSSFDGCFNADIIRITPQVQIATQITTNTPNQQSSIETNTC